MMVKKLAPVFLLPLLAAAAGLPNLRTEPIGGGTVFFVKNTSSQPLTAYLIELVGYPGSSYYLWQEDILDPIAPGAEKRIQVTNMTAGAVPDYMKIMGAVYADGSLAGDKGGQIVERRKAVLTTARELIQKMEKGATAADLKKWADSLEPVGKVKATAQPVINQAASRQLINETAATMDLPKLKQLEKALGGL
jgi:hypothetical protein